MKKIRKNKDVIAMVTLLIALLVIYYVLNNGGDIKSLGLVEARFQVTIDGKVVNFTDELGHPYLTKTDRTVIPVRIISENMGYNVDWEPETKKAFVSNGKTKIELQIGKNSAIVNGKIVPIDVQNGKPVDTKAMLVPVKGSRRTYVPLRFVSEAMGAKVTYERKNGVHCIGINTGKVKPKEGNTYSGITFDPAKDLLDDGSGRMSAEKAEEFLEKMLQNSKFYKKNGKYYFKYDKVEVPEGFTAGIAFSVSTGGSGVKPVNLTPNPFTNPKESKIPKGESFVKQVRNDAVEAADLFMLQIAIVKDGYDGKQGGSKSSVSYKIDFDPIVKTATRTVYDKWKSGHTSPYNASSIFSY